MKERDLTGAVLAALALLTALAGILRIFDSGISDNDQLGATTLLYFAVAGGLLMLRQVKSLAFGDYKLELHHAAAEAREAGAEALNAARIAEDAVIHHTLPQGMTAALPAAESGSGTIPSPGPYEDDPWKDALGGASVDNASKRRLRAEVSELSTRRGWYSIRLIVESTAALTHPLTGHVRFLLHDTFVNDRPVVPVGPDGRAQLSVIAWGAFTAGAIADGGATVLELDLGELETAPTEFRSR